jgi:hypothetical protein
MDAVHNAVVLEEVAFHELPYPDAQPGSLPCSRNCWISTICENTAQMPIMDNKGIIKGDVRMIDLKQI